MTERIVFLSTEEALKARPMDYLCTKCRHNHIVGGHVWEEHLKYAERLGVSFTAEAVVKALEDEGVHLDSEAWSRVWQRAWKKTEAGAVR